jgi:cytochrome c oxidase subunit 1/cytochrome c oxidase subunit I+III
MTTAFSPRPAAGAGTHDEADEERGVYAWIATVDHKKIGILYLLTSLVFFAIGGTEALVMRLQLARPNATLVSPDTFNQLFTMHGTTMIFLVVMPTLAGFANYFVPLMIGARDMAFPRLNALSYWLFPCGGFLLHFSLVAGGAPNAGWFGYAPLTEMGFSSTQGTDYWALAILVLGVGSVATSINMVATIATLRVPGLTMKRLPLFVWMMLVTSLLILLALPVLNAALVMLLIDRQLQAHFFLPSSGGNAIVWQHFFWTFGHPEVYIMALPAFGMISEIIPVFSKKPLFGYEFVAASGVAIGVLSFGVWAHHMFAVGLGHTVDLVFAGGSMLIAIPTGVKIFNWIATMYGGSIRFNTSMLFATAFLVEFVIGGLSGITFATAPVDWQVTDTYYLVAHFHYVLFGGTAFAVMAATYYWFPKMSGVFLSEKLGRVHFWSMVVGFNTTFFVQHFLGIMGMPRRVFTYPDLPGWAALNLLSTVGAFMMGGSVLVFLYNIGTSLRSGMPAGDNPWDGCTLEWATTSPPHTHNFEQVPPVRGRRPLWDLARAKSSTRAPLAPTPPTLTHPLDKNKIALWCLIASETGFFIILVFAYVFYNLAHEGGPTAAGVLDASRAGAFTVSLLSSSVTLTIAERRLAKGKGTASAAWLAATIFLGLVFLVGQASEYLALWRGGVTISRNIFATTFFTLTGFHGLHVVVGLIMLVIFATLVARGDYKKKASTALVAAGLYWHFVDAVWIVVFSVVYLRQG